MTKKRNIKRDKSKIVNNDEKYDSTKFWIENSIDLYRRRIMIDEDIDEFSVGWAIRGLRRMVDEDREKPIDIYVNSYGGVCYDGFGLYDFIRACDFTTIRTHATGKIMSMGLTIYLAGDERYSSPNSRFMAHSVSGGVEGKLHEVAVDAEELKTLHDMNVDILSDRTLKGKAWWKKQLKYEDKYYSKQDAIDLGIVTEKEFEIK